MLAEKFAALLPHLNERQRRLAVAAEAKALGRGGVSVVARASGLSRPTVYKAMAELDAPEADPDRARRAGGGRKRVVVKDPRLLADLERLVDPATRGDPSSPPSSTPSAPSSTMRQNMP